MNDEKQIVSLLNTFSDACNRGDLSKIESVFHDGGIYNSVRGGQVTKSKIAQTDPEWRTLAGKIQLNNPKFNINGNDATVAVTAKRGTHFKAANIFTLVKEDGNWLIMKLE